MTTLQEGRSVSASLETLEGDAEDLEHGSTDNVDNKAMGKARRILRTVYKGARSLVGLGVLLIVYAVLGALAFMLVESRHEQIYKSNITNIRENMISELLSKSLIINDTTAWKSETKTMLLNYEGTIRDAIENSVNSDSTVEVWSMWSSLFFVFTVFTTIGYGNLAPVTGLGRLLCILYAGIGIPLALLLLAELGKRFTMFLKFGWAFVRRYYYNGWCQKLRERTICKKKYEINEDTNNSEVNEETNEMEGKSEDGKSEDRSRSGSTVVYGYEIDDEFNVPITIAIIILLVYILLGAIMYSFWEDWGFIEAIYFVFISISTIGFGDVLPAHQKFFVVSSIYMFIGLSLVSMCINVAIEFFNVAAIRAKRRVEEAKKKIGDKAKKAHKSAKEKMTELKTNISDETTKLKQKTDVKIAGIKSNISEETTKFRKKADDKFRKKSKDKIPTVSDHIALELR